MKHVTRFSDSSFYDEVCTVYGGTDTAGDDTLKHPCQGDPELASLAQARRKVEDCEISFKLAVHELGLKERAYKEKHGTLR